MTTKNQTGSALALVQTVILRGDETERKASQKQIDALISIVKETGVSFDAAVCQAALLTLAHAANFGDVRPCQALFDAMPKAARAESLKAWFQHNGPIWVGKEGWREASEKEAKGRANGEGLTYNLIRAELVGPFDKGETVQKPLSLEAILKMVTGAAAKAAKAEVGEGFDGTAEEAERANQLAKRLKSLAGEFAIVKAAA